MRPGRGSPARGTACRTTSSGFAASGKRNEELLNSLGIYHFGQIAAWTPAEARWVANHLPSLNASNAMTGSVRRSSSRPAATPVTSRWRNGEGVRKTSRPLQRPSHSRQAISGRFAGPRRSVEIEGGKIARDHRVGRKGLALDADDEGGNALEDRVVDQERRVALAGDGERSKRGCSFSIRATVSADRRSEFSPWIVRTGTAASAPNSFHNDGIGRSNSTPSKVFARAGS